MKQRLHHGLDRLGLALTNLQQSYILVMIYRVEVANIALLCLTSKRLHPFGSRLIRPPDDEDVAAPRVFAFEAIDFHKHSPPQNTSLNQSSLSSGYPRVTVMGHDQNVVGSHLTANDATIKENGA